jgi:cyclophilin family peptidyl-prolyl cis-trans isomerase
VLAQLIKEFPNDVRLVYRHFPLMSIHDKAALAAQAAEAAGAQGKFWEMHDLLFAEQGTWSEMSVDEFQTWLVDQAEGLGLDKEQFSTDLVNETNKSLVQKAWDRGQKIGLPGTPFILINGRYYGGPKDPASMTAIVKLTQLEDEQYTKCPPMVIDPLRQYVATLKTEKGDIVLELYPDVAPMAVNSFVFLAREGWFDGVTFHRVIPGLLAQAGDPTGTGYGGPGYAFDNEISADLKFDRPGVLGMANAGPSSNGSQFFITLAPMTQLDGDYTVFGQVIAGLDVVENLTPRDPQQDPNQPPGDKILGVNIEEK